MGIETSQVLICLYFFWLLKTSEWKSKIDQIKQVDKKTGLEELLLDKEKTSPLKAAGVDRKKQ